MSPVPPAGAAGSHHHLVQEASLLDAFPPSARAQRDAVLSEQIEAVHQAGHGTYGAYRVHKQLRRQGVQVARCTMERLMRAHGL